MTTVTAQLSLRRHYKCFGESHGKECLKRKYFRRPRKTDIESADVTCWVDRTEVRIAVIGKARSSTVGRRVRRTVRKQSRGLFLQASKSARYHSVDILYTRTASLNWVLSGALSQCSGWKSRVMWSYTSTKRTPATQPCSRPTDGDNGVEGLLPAASTVSRHRSYSSLFVSIPVIR